MSNDYTIGVDQFAQTVEDIIGRTVESIEKDLPEVTKQACKVGRDSARMYASEKIGGTGRYVGGFVYKTMKKSGECVGEIGNKTPGLVHLLEKGHARVGGGRVRAIPHLKYAADDTFKEFERLVDETVDKAL